MTRRTWLLSGLAASAFTQSRPTATGRRFALVIGNSAYLHLRPLRNPINDARALGDALRKTGFQVLSAENATAEQMDAAAKEFLRKIMPGDAALFYYSGHAMQIEGENYLLPVDLSADNSIQVKHRSLMANELLEEMQGSGARLKVVILDACRDNPFGTSKSLAGAGLNFMSAGSGSLIAYATAVGKTADDNPKGANALYTGALLETMRKPGLKLPEVFEETARIVQETSRGTQEPWISMGVVPEFYFVPTAGPSLPAKLDLPPKTTVAALHDKWALVVGVGRFADRAIGQLIYAAKDALDFAALLADPEVGRFPKDHVFVLTDAQATTAGIKREMNLIARHARKDDLAVIYLAGHGSPREMDTAGTNYFITYDTQVDDADSLYGTALPFVELNILIRSRIAAERLMLLLDVSHAGAMWFDTPQITVAAPAPDATERGRVIMASCRANEQAWDSEKFPNGYFMHFLLEALRSSKGMLSALELYNSIAPRLSAQLLQDLKASQHPVLTMGGAETRVVIGEPVG